MMATKTKGLTVASGQAPKQSTNDLDYPVLQRRDKRFKNTRAELGYLGGYALYRSDPQDGEQALFLERWGMVKRLPDLEAAEQILADLKASHGQRSR